MPNARLLALASVLLALPAFAQQEPERDEQGRIIQYEKNSKIDFDVKTIEVDGGWKPIGIRVTSRGDEKFPSMIQERTHFKRELAKSIGVSVKAEEK